MNDSQPRVHVPNFDLMTQHLQGFTDEFKHCRNLSAVESTTTLLAAINGLKTQMEQLSAQFSVQIGEVKQEVGDLKQEVGDIKRDLGSLNRRMTNSDRNNVIRLENSGEKNANDVIRPLVNLETGEEIAGFPASISDLDRLRPTIVVRILRELGLPGDGNARVNKMRLMRAIGLTSLPLGQA